MISLGFSIGFPKLNVDLEMCTSLTKENPSLFKTYKHKQQLTMQVSLTLGMWSLAVEAASDASHQLNAHCLWIMETRDILYP